jgi:cytochrome c oxidase cbb3-type subunit 4
METYSFLRELADSWVLLALTLFFIGTVLWAWRPGSRKLHEQTAMIPFRNETIGCASKCPDCTCKVSFNIVPEDAS